MSSEDRDTEMSESPDTLTRVKELWWDDGNLVIKAGHKMFKVYGGLLASRSSVFADMLSIPQPDEAEKIDGCSVAALPDDEDDVKEFLLALFDYKVFSYELTASEHFKSNMPTCKAVVGVLRLSHKYNEKHLRRRAILHLESIFTRDLSAYLEQCSSFCFDFEELEDITSVVSVAREVGATWLLPSAFYVMTKEWLQDSDITDVFGDDQLSRDRYTHGATRQIYSHLRLLKFLTNQSSRPECETAQKCSKARYTELSELEFWDHNDDRASDPLEIWVDADFDGLAVCKACKRAARQEHKGAREDFWQRLPEIYELPPWDELEEMQKKSMIDGDEKESS